MSHTVKPRSSADPALLSLVMPMAGRGSRFIGSEVLPKPLINLDGRPFFWWAVESVRRLGPVGEMVFVVLEEHVRDFAIDARIREYYPAAKIEQLSETTPGAAVTAAVGVAALRSANPVAICDSDHAFVAWGCDTLAGWDQHDGVLLCFPSHDPAYSFIRIDTANKVVETVEKRVVSDCAIAGCYLFATPQSFLEAWDNYRLTCPYSEPFISGLYNTLLAGGGRVDWRMLDRHLSFGTPAEFAKASIELERQALWA